MLLHWEGSIESNGTCGGLVYLMHVVSESLLAEARVVLQKWFWQCVGL